MIIDKIKRIVPAHIKNFLKGLIYKIDFFPLRKINEKKIVILSTPLHGNLGDHAIVEAQKFFLQSIFPDRYIWEVTTSQFDACAEQLKNYLEPDDIVTLVGGGSMGTNWPWEEKRMQRAVQAFPNHKVVIFPQTIHYEDTPQDLQALEESKRTYNNHRNLTICAREKASFEVMKAAYPECNILLIPDIVLHINKLEISKERAGILLCLREDKESKLTYIEKKSIFTAAKGITEKVLYIDTVVNHSVSKKDRQYRLSNKLSEFAGAKLVITDRLHGMIFAAITQTPCIVLNNYNHKVKGVYEWIKSLEYIRFIESIEELPKHLKRLYSIKDCVYKSSCLEEHFNKLKEQLV